MAFYSYNNHFLINSQIQDAIKFYVLFWFNICNLAPILKHSALWVWTSPCFAVPVKTYLQTTVFLTILEPLVALSMVPLCLLSSVPPLKSLTHFCKLVVQCENLTRACFYLPESIPALERSRGTDLCVLLFVRILSSTYHHLFFVILHLTFLNWVYKHFPIL